MGFSSVATVLFLTSTTVACLDDTAAVDGEFDSSNSDGKADTVVPVVPSPQPVAAPTVLTVGIRHACGIDPTGAVACWGYRQDGAATPPEGVFTSISAGSSHTCGLKADGTVVCWGKNDHGESTPPDERFTSVSAGGEHTCGITTAGRIACWGRDFLDFDQLTLPPDGIHVAVSVGNYNACALKADGSITCWGARTRDWNRIDGVFTTVTVGPGFVCGLTAGGARCSTIGLYANRVYEQRFDGQIKDIIAGPGNVCVLGTTTFSWPARITSGLGCATWTYHTGWIDTGVPRRLQAQEFTALSIGGFDYVPKIAICGKKGDGSVICSAPNAVEHPPRDLILQH